GEYWLGAIVTTAPSSFIWWRSPDALDFGPQASSSDGGTTWNMNAAPGGITTNRGAFDVIGQPVTPVPEPPTIGLFGVGLFGLLILPARKRFPIIPPSESQK